MVRIPWSVVHVRRRREATQEVWDQGLMLRHPAPDMKAQDSAKRVGDSISHATGSISLHTIRHCILLISLKQQERTYEWLAGNMPSVRVVVTYLGPAYPEAITV